MIRIILLLLLLPFKLCAQDTLPPLGIIYRADLEMKDCSFDPGAEACMLIATRRLSYKTGELNLLKMILTNRYRIKILKEKGQGYADVKTRFYSYKKMQHIHDVKAWSYNLDTDGNIKSTPVDASAIVIHPVDDYFSELIISFPAVKTGSVIEYEYLLDQENQTYVQDWYFQREIPVRYSRLDMKAPVSNQFIERARLSDSVQKKQQSSRENFYKKGMHFSTEMLTRTHIMKNLRGVREEPYMRSPADYMQHISYEPSDVVAVSGKKNRNTIAYWQDVAENLWESKDFGGQMDVLLPAADNLIAQAASCSSMECRMAVILKQLRQFVTWSGEYSIYATEGIIKTWENRTGSSGELNTLLINLLKKAGVPAYPLLASTRQHGKVNINFASERQFNTLLVYVENGNNSYILDLTNKHTSYLLTPATIVNNWCLLLRPNENRWILAEATGLNKLVTSVTATITADEIMQGVATVSCQEYARTARIQEWYTDTTAYVRHHFTAPFTSINITKVDTRNQLIDSLPFIQSVFFNTALSKSGPYRYVTVNMFSSLETNPFVADNRISEIDFGYLPEYTTIGSFTIPDGYIFEAVPTNLLLQMPDSSIRFTRTADTIGNKLNLTILLQFSKEKYSASEYPALQQFYKKMFAHLSEQVVIRKQ